MNWFIWQVCAVLSINCYILSSKFFGKFGIIYGHLMFSLTVLLIGWTVTVAYQKTDFIRAFHIQSAMLPIIGVIIGTLCFGEIPTIKQLFGILMSMIGIYFIV